jgi:hypothetical protein
MRVFLADLGGNLDALIATARPPENSS